MPHGRRDPSHIPNAVDLAEQDAKALEALEPGMSARAGGVTGFIEEVVPERGEVSVTSAERAVTVPARRVELTDPDAQERFDEVTGRAKARRDMNELSRRFGLEDQV